MHTPSAPGAPGGSGTSVALLILMHLATHYPAQEEIGRFRAGGPKCGPFSRAARTAFARARARAPSAPGAPGGSVARVSLLILVHLATTTLHKKRSVDFELVGPNADYSHTRTAVEAPRASRWAPIPADPSPLPEDVQGVLRIAGQLSRSLGPH